MVVLDLSCQVDTLPGPLVSLTGSVFQDALSLFLGVPGSTIGRAFDAYMRRRGEAARDVLLDELRQAETDTLTVASEDDAIGVIYRYFLAARDGAARRNLRLLAKVIVGLATRDRLFSEEFNKYAEILSRLSRDQIFVAGRYHAHFQEELASAADGDTTHARADAWTALKEELIPAHFETQDYLEAICSQLGSTGLLFQISVYGGNAYKPSPILDEVAQLANFETVLGDE